MNRVRDYANFAAWFAGLGYIVLWPLTAVQPLPLPPGLHAAGSASAIFVGMRLVSIVLKRTMRQRAPAHPPPAPPQAPAPSFRLRRRPLPPPAKVKPRTQFGLRGAPR